MKKILWLNLLILTLLLPNAAQAAADTWVGNTSGYWGGANWIGGNNPPVNGDSLIFGAAGSAGSLLTNNLASLGVNNISINGSGAFTLGGNSLTLTNGLNDAAAVNGTIRLIIGGPGGLTNSGTGTLTLSGANTYTGSTTISAGTLQIGDGNEATVGAGMGVLAVGTNTLLLNLNGPATLSNSSVTSSGTIQNIGTGKVMLTNDATIGGVLYPGSAGLILASALTGTGGIIICGGDVTMSGNGYVSVYSFNTATTAHITNAGSFQQIGGANPQGAMTLDIASGVTCSENIWQNGDTKYYNNLMGAGSFVFQGSTTAPGSYGYVLGSSTLGGTLTVGGSGLSFGNGGWGGLAGATTIVANSDVTFNSTSNNTYSGTMSGTGGLVKLGTNTLTLAGTNTFTGNITVNGGTLVLQQPSPFGNLAVTVSNGCVLRLNFVGTNQVAALVVNGVSQTPGFYNSTTSAPYLAGTGSLHVIGVPVVGNTNSPSLLPQQILAVYNAGYSNVTVNPGTYVMANGTNTAVTLQSLQNFTINASNVIMTVGTGDCFDLLNCTNVTIEGVTVRAQIYPFTQGRVTGMGTNNGTLYCDWQISVGYPNTNFLWWFNAVSAGNQTINIQQGDIFYGNDFGTNSSGVASNAVYLDNQTWQLNFPGWSGFSFQTNDWLVARWGNQGHAYQLSYCSNCTLRNCNSQCGGFGTFFEQHSVSNHILDCQIQPSPVPPPGGSELPVVAGGMDGIHVVWDVRGPDIENFTATNVMLDDCIAIHGSYQRVAAVSGYDVTFYLHTLFPCGDSWDNAGFAVGQPVRISDTNGFFAQANCTAIQNLTNYQVITLDKELAIPIGAVGSNPDAKSNGYKVINCQLGNTRSRAIIAKADNGLIAGCSIDGAGEGIELGPEYYWGEADYVWNVTISNNVVQNCANVGIAVISDGSAGNQNITIQCNTIENLLFSDGLSVSGCNGITISGNTFISPDAGYYPIYLYNSTNVTLLENLVTNAPAGTALVESDASVTGINNLQNGIFLAGAYSFVNRLSNLVLNDPANGGAGTQVTQQAGVAGNNSWTLSPVGNGYCALVCASNGLALGVGGSTASNAPLVLETYTGSKSQLWALAPVTNFFVALTNALSGMAAQVESSVAGQGLVQAPFNGSASQQWLLDVLSLPIWTWDPQGTSGANPYLGSMTGTWENADWSTSSTGQTSPVGWSEGNNALFAVNTGTGTPAFTVTMNSGHTVAGIYNGSATTGPCTVTLNGNGTITNNSGMVFDTISPGSTTISNVIAGSGGVTVEGSGILELSASNTYTGATIISSPGAFPAAGYNLTVVNSSFETPTETTYVYQTPAGSGSHTQNFGATSGIGWTFNSGSGIDCNASKTFYPINAPNGTQAAFIQGNSYSAISQNVTFPSTGTYQVSWSSIGRAGAYGPQTLILEIDGNPIESFTPVQTAWTSYTSPCIYLSAGVHTLTFHGTATTDLTSCIDNVQIIALQGGVVPTDPGMGAGAGTLILGSTGSINSSSAISIAAGATLDVSAITSFVLSSNTTFIASGAGTATGSTAATINGAAGGTVSLGSQPISLIVTPTTFAGDTTHPALYISQGTLSLHGNAFTVNNASGTALGAGTYRLIQEASGSINNSGSNLVSVTGSGLAGADMASIQVSGGNVNLVVTAPPAIQTTTVSGSSITFTWSTITNRTYQIQSTTSLAPANWINASSVVTATNSTMTLSEPIGTNSQQFYRIVLLP